MLVDTTANANVKPSRLQEQVTKTRNELQKIMYLLQQRNSNVK